MSVKETSSEHAGVSRREQLNGLRSYLYKSKLRLPSGEPVVAP